MQSLYLVVMFCCTFVMATLGQNWTNHQQALRNITLVENLNNFLPIMDIPSYHLSFISNTGLGGDSLTAKPCFQTLQHYAAIDYIYATQWQQLQQAQATKKNKKSTGYNPKPLWIVAYYATDSLAAQDFFAKIDTTAQQQQAEWVVLVFGNVQFLPNLPTLKQLRATLLCFTATESTQSLAAQIVFGAVSPMGKLPSSAGKYKKGYGLSIPKISRLSYTYAAEVNLPEKLSQRIDSLVQYGLKMKAMPSCQVLVAVKGKVFFHRSYGFSTYDSLQATQWNSVYDVASLTKILAGTLAIMKLYEQQRWKLDQPLGTFFPSLKKSNKQNITWRDLLTHQAQVPAGIPFWQLTLDKKGQLDKKWYSRVPTKQYSWQVADSLYVNPNIQQTYLKAFKQAELLPHKKYLYSDLPFILTTFVVPLLSKQTLDKYVNQYFYQSLGANYLVFNPLNKFGKQQIIPTEYDSSYRKQLLHGTVHDESAALLGGVSGNAGLFANANDVAKILQMLLQHGEYGGKNYLQSATLHQFTRCQYCWQQGDNFRGLGFNRQVFNPNPNSHAAVSATEQSFGHTGFTGTYAWVDKDYDLIYVFLSNRVYPTRKNQQLMELNLRTQILEEVYQALQHQPMIKVGE